MTAQNTRISVPALPSTFPRPAPRGYPWTFLFIAGVIILGLVTAGVRPTIGWAGFLLELVFVAYLVRHLAFVISALRAAPRAMDIAAPDV